MVFTVEFMGRQSVSPQRVSHLRKAPVRVGLGQIIVSCLIYV